MALPAFHAALLPDSPAYLLIRRAGALGAGDPVGWLLHSSSSSPCRGLALLHQFWRGGAGRPGSRGDLAALLASTLLAPLLVGTLALRAAGKAAAQGRGWASSTLVPSKLHPRSYKSRCITRRRVSVSAPPPPTLPRPPAPEQRPSCARQEIKLQGMTLLTREELVEARLAAWYCLSQRQQAAAVSPRAVPLLRWFEGCVLLSVDVSGPQEFGPAQPGPSAPLRWPGGELLAALPQAIKDRCTGSSTGDSAVAQLACGRLELLVHPPALTSDGSSPVDLTVAVRADGSAGGRGLLVELRQRLRPMFWSPALSIEVPPLRLEGPREVEGLLTWAVTLPGAPLLAPTCLDCCLGLAGADGSLQQTLPLGAAIPVVPNESIW